MPSGADRRILTVVGARPQFIKAAAVSRALRATAGLAETIVHTGQHFDPGMSEIFFAELDIPPPAHNLGIHGGHHGTMTGRMMAALEEICLAERPDWVLVYGDTNSTLAGALVAAKLNIPVAHVEAGLRSFNRSMPEEVNRVVTDHLSTLLLCPTTAAVANLAAEGVADGVHMIGDVMYDVALHAARAAAGRPDPLASQGLEPGGYHLATIHRAENTDDPATLAALLGYLRDQAGPVLLLIHPRTRAAVERFRLSLDGIRVSEPVGYLDMHRLIAGALSVMTDSGGLQKEAYFHRVPCVTLRGETEWVETIEAGWNRLWRGPDYRPRRDIPDYGDGRAAEAVAFLLREQA